MSVPSNPHNLSVTAHAFTAADRRDHYGHDGAVLWLTGLSASGNSTQPWGAEGYCRDDLVPTTTSSPVDLSEDRFET